MATDGDTPTAECTCTVLDRAEMWPFIKKCENEATINILNDHICRRFEISLICQMHLEHLLEAFPGTEYDSWPIPGRLNESEQHEPEQVSVDRPGE